jgi:hypothetical protein
LGIGGTSASLAAGVLSTVCKFRLLTPIIDERSLPQRF